MIYNEDKSTWSNLNYLHDDIWRKENLTLKINFEKN